MAQKVCARCGRVEMYADLQDVQGRECWRAFSGSPKSRAECAERQAKVMRDLLAEWRTIAATVLDVADPDMERYRVRWMRDFARSVDAALALEAC